MIPVTKKEDVKYYLTNGLTMCKTLDLAMFGTTVSVSHRYDKELEPVYVLKFCGIIQHYYDFSKLLSVAENIYDTLETASCSPNVLAYFGK